MGGLSLASTELCATVATLAILAGLFVLVVNYFQKNNPEKLPEKLRTWEFLPEWARSLAPLDRVVCAPLGVVCAPICGKCQPKESTVATEVTTEKRASDAKT